MSRKSKWLGAAIAGLALCIAAYFVGFRLGSERTNQQTSMILIGSNALDQRTALKMLENNDIDAAKKYLNASLDADVLHLRALVASGASSDLRTRSQHVLEIIAADRTSKEPYHSGH